jgi:hypothetical protein
LDPPTRTFCVELDNETGLLNGLEDPLHCTRRVSYKLDLDREVRLSIMPSSQKRIDPQPNAVVPMLRPLRVLRSARLLRVLRLARLVAFAVEGLQEVREILRRRGLSWVLLIVVALNLVAAALVLTFEQDTPGGNIHSYPDALWWAVTTITTVGYGDRFPMSPAGRGVAVVLMVSGIALFGVITASIAAYFVEQKAEHDLAGRLDASWSAST